MRKSDSSDDRKCRKYRSKSKFYLAGDKNTANLKVRDAIKKKRRQKRTKQDFSDSSYIKSDFSNDCYYKSKKHNKNKKYQKSSPIKLCAKLMEKLLAKAYEYNKKQFKLDEDMIHVRDLDYKRLIRQGSTTNQLSWQGNVDYRKSALDYVTLGRACRKCFFPKCFPVYS